MPKIKYNGIVAYTYLNMYEKNHPFLSSVKRDAHKTKLVSFFSASQCRYYRVAVTVTGREVQGFGKLTCDLCRVYLLWIATLYK